MFVWLESAVPVVQCFQCPLERLTAHCVVKARQAGPAVSWVASLQFGFYSLSKDSTSSVPESSDRMAVSMLVQQPDYSRI